MNNSPLEFNKNKSRTMDDKDETSQSLSDKRSRGSSRNKDRRDTDKSLDSDSSMSNSQDVIPLQNSSSIGPPAVWGGMMGK